MGMRRSLSGLQTRFIGLICKSLTNESDSQVTKRKHVAIAANWFVCLAAQFIWFQSKLETNKGPVRDPSSPSMHVARWPCETKTKTNM